MSHKNANSGRVEYYAALELLKRLPTLADDNEDYAKVQQFFELLRVRLYFNFGTVKK